MTGVQTCALPIYDSGHQIRLVLDQALKEGGPINAHPLTNTMTSAIAFADLLRFFAATGHEPAWLDLGVA